MFANTCRHRAHELLPDDGASARRSVVRPYHAWSYDLAGDLVAAPGYRDEPGFDATAYSLVELPVETWCGWVFGHALHPLGHPDVVAFSDHLGELGSVVEPYRPADLRLADRHTYEIAANWKIVAENYHECYHCPLIHPELCQVTPPRLGRQLRLPGAWVGGSMALRDGMATMSLTGESSGNPIPGVPPTAVQHLHLLPNLLVSAHPDYVMTHRLVPLAPGRTWIEAPGSSCPPPTARCPTRRTPWSSGTSPTGRTGPRASRCRRPESPHFAPGPLSPDEDAVERFVGLVSRAYVGLPVHERLTV